MIDFTIHTQIERPAADVFSYVTDPGRLPSWQTNTVSAVVEGGGPVALGARLREVHRGPGGRELVSLVEVARYEPDRVFALRMIEGALPIDAEITLEPDGDATRMSFRVHGQPAGLMRLAAPMLRVALRRQFAAHCATLKQVLEAGT